MANIIYFVLGGMAMSKVSKKYAKLREMPLQLPDTD
jgi:hypothetical protein